VLRQFGCRQSIPPAPITRDVAQWETLHRGQGMTGRAYTDWAAFHSELGKTWAEHRDQNVLPHQPVDQFLEPEEGYIDWFHRRTVRLISNPNNYPAVQQDGDYQPMAERA
ncbi:Serine/threonine-protein phosphatase 7 long form homolog, partial [Striga hermonthica]